MKIKNLAVFASGTGSNFINIHNEIVKHNIKGDIKILISNNPHCGAVNFAKENNIDFKIINDFKYPDDKKEKEYELVLKYYKINLILLAGFLKKIPINIINLFHYKIINIHPSLLPKYGGPGFYGMVVHEAVIRSKDKLSGATVHFVIREYDKGPIVIQRKIKVEVSDDSFTLSKKVLKVEHQIYIEAVKAFCLDKIQIINNKVKINE